MRATQAGTASERARAESTEPRDPTPLQHAMVLKAVRNGGTGVDVEQVVARLGHAIDPRALRRAWAKVTQQHEALRTAFDWTSSSKLTQLAASETNPTFDYEDWRGYPPDTHDGRLRSWLEQDRTLGFKLDEPPLSRVKLIQERDDAFTMIWTFHHAIIDGRSQSIILEELLGLLDNPDREVSLDHPVDQVGRPSEKADPAAQRFWQGLTAGLEPAAGLGLAGSGTPDSLRPFGECEASLDDLATDRLRSLADHNALTLNTIVQGAWAILLGRYGPTDDIVVGVARAGRNTIAGAERAVGMFMNTIPVRVTYDPSAELIEWLSKLRAQHVTARPFERTSLAEIKTWAGIQPGEELFHSIVVYDHQSLNQRLRSLGPQWEHRTFRLHEWTGYPLTLYATADGTLDFRLVFDAALYDRDSAKRMIGHLVNLLRSIADDSAQLLGELRMLGASELEQLDAWNQTEVEFPSELTIHEALRSRAEESPSHVALVAGPDRLTFQELDTRANRLARLLLEMEIAPSEPIGVHMGRTADLVVALLAIMKAGGAYLPLDPDFPADRLDFMIEDAGVRTVISDDLSPGRFEASVRTLDLERLRSQIDHNSPEPPKVDVLPSDLCYVLYTSGSTGKPKGVMVTHRNVVNFFTAMDHVVPTTGPGVWLATTTVSFDISVLELLWTLSRGFTVVLGQSGIQFGTDSTPSSEIEFSLFYFASDAGEAGADKYRLLLEGARFADANGFTAVWTPERHFHAFGGLYPNPAVAGAAIAAVTDRVDIRAGSCVLPLHDPIRVAEEWAVVDNISGGRVGISFAAGWHPNDFVLNPGAYTERKERLTADIETVRRLWRGEQMRRAGPDGSEIEVSTLPRPIQAELPVWLTAAGNPETFREAGRNGFNVLTHLLGQSVEELAEKLKAYRASWREAGHAGDGHVTLMLHTLVGDNDDEVRETVRKPLTAYLASSVDLVKQAAWTFPALRERADRTGTEPGRLVESGDLSDEDRRALLDHAFDRYFETSGLFGTPETCRAQVEQLQAAGVDEIACLIDFGVPTETVLDSLGALAALSTTFGDEPGSPNNESTADLITRHGVTHYQCTPSHAQLLMADAPSRAALAQLDVLLVGGEAFPLALAEQLVDLGPTVTNMYGPTETTIWSTTHRLEGREHGLVPIGRPIANTTLHITDRHGAPVPIGVAGELLIGGEGVTAGYLNRPGMTGERFVTDETSGRTLYRTGDLARFAPDGTVEFLGRNDSQVKLRGHRIELGEIEGVLDEHPSVERSVVMVREDRPGDRRLVGYVIPRRGNADAESLRSHLASHLPEIMVPSSFVMLAEFPLTPNGKVERAALPAPEGTGGAEPGGPTADTATARLLAEVWRSVLGVPEVAPTDDFFRLGGHSLLAIEVSNRLRNVLGRPVPLELVFRHTTFTGLAHALETTSGANGGDDAVDTYHAEIGALIEKHLSIRVDNEGTDLIESGLLDSLSVVRLASIVDEQFSLGLEPGEVVADDYRSIATIAAMVAGRRASYT